MVRSFIKHISLMRVGGVLCNVRIRFTLKSLTLPKTPSTFIKWSTLRFIELMCFSLSKCGTDILRCVGWLWGWDCETYQNGINKTKQIRKMPIKFVHQIRVWIFKCLFFQRATMIHNKNQNGPVNFHHRVSLRPIKPGTLLISI